MCVGFQALKKKGCYFFKKDIGFLKKVLYLHPQYESI